MIRKLKQLIWKLRNKRVGKLINLPEGTDCLWKLDDIIVPKYFKRSSPRRSKVKEYTKRYERLNHLDKPILVKRIDSKSHLVILKDQYIRWIIAKRKGLDEVPIQWYKKK